MNCNDDPKLKIIYFSFFLPRVSVSPKTSTSVFTMDRRIRKIENVCHCKIKIDTINPNICKTLLNGYHLFEIYYNESKGNHTGCMSMLKELLGDSGHIQAVVTITKSKEGRIHRSNSLTDVVSYRLYQSSIRRENVIASKDTIEEVKEMEQNISDDYILENLPIDEKEIPSLELIQEEVISERNSTILTKKSHNIDDDKLFQLYTIKKPFNYDSEEYAVIIKSNRLESVNSYDSEEESSTTDDVIPMDIKIPHLKCEDDSLSEDEFVSILSSCPSNLSSSSSSFEDAISKSTEDLDKDNCSLFKDCQSVLGQLDYRILKSTNMINNVIDDIGKECYNDVKNIFKDLIHHHVANVKSVITKYIFSILEGVTSDDIELISHDTFKMENILWLDLFKLFLEILEENVIFTIQVICENKIQKLIDKKNRNKISEDMLSLTSTEDLSSVHQTDDINSVK